MPKIDRFDGDYYFLSNFYEAPFTFEGVYFLTVEHAFQYAKATDPEEKEFIRTTANPINAKKLGRVCQMRDDWHKIRVMVMSNLLKAKFDQHPELREKLLATGDAELIEGNWWGDTFWGVHNGQGENNLGILLMMLRQLYSETLRVQETGKV